MKSTRQLEEFNVHF